jgi:sigma-54 dependent transcriptional regulator, acetoin dehydrogenase operon transcriptional activator AcoR
MDSRFSLLEREWEQYIIAGDLKENHTVSKTIISSWERCIKAKVNAYDGKCHRLAGEELFNNEDNVILLDAAGPLMASVYDNIKGSGCVAALVSKDGFLLSVLGDYNVMKNADEINFVEGANWNESSVGTNAMGTCLEIGRPLQVNGPEHYCRKHHLWTCSAAPISTPAGTIAGCLNVSGPWQKRHPHTLGMVVAKAQAMENRLLQRQAEKDLDISRTQFRTVADAIPEGILTINSEGIVISANLAASNLLSIRQEEFTGKNVEELLEEKPNLKEMFNAQGIDHEKSFNLQTERGRLRCIVSPDVTNNVQDRKHGTVIIVKKIVTSPPRITPNKSDKPRHTFEDIISKNKGMIEAEKIAKRVADSDSTVIILGESGTGKEMFAQAIHNRSERRRNPFVAVNCGGMAKDLIQSELFGYISGAFTGAKRDGRPGKFEAAQNGTIFLDEIGDMPLDLQANLLRVLEEGSVVRVGSSVARRVNVRVIAATNRDLRQMVNEFTFRRDLFYRINVVTIELCPLRERTEDIELLVECLLGILSQKLGKEIWRAGDMAMNFLKEYYWPGNVRELRNALEHSIHKCETNVIGINDLPGYMRGSKREAITVPGELRTLKELEAVAITNTLERCEYNISKSARTLGISRNTLYGKIKKNKIILPNSIEAPRAKNDMRLD